MVAIQRLLPALSLLVFAAMPQHALPRDVGELRQHLPADFHPCWGRWEHLRLRAEVVGKGACIAGARRAGSNEGLRGGGEPEEDGLDVVRRTQKAINWLAFEDMMEREVSPPSPEAIRY